MSLLFCVISQLILLMLFENPFASMRLTPLYALFFIVMGFWSGQVGAFSETEIESLRDSGAKALSKSPWRTHFSLALQRGLAFDSRFVSRNSAADSLQKKEIQWKDLLNPNISGSLADMRHLYYSARVQIHYSLKERFSNSPFLKKTELFLSGAFVTPFSGYPHRTNRHDYGAWDYMGYGLRDMAFGATRPLYNRENFFIEGGLALVPYPLSLFSKEAGFRGRIQGILSALYFLKKSKKASLFLDSSHSLAYSHYVKKTADSGYRDNIPFDTIHSLGFGFRQAFINCLPGFSRAFFLKRFGWRSFACAPSSVRVFASYYLGIDSYLARFVLDGAQNHDLSLGIGASWRLARGWFLSPALQWKDRVYVYSPRHKEVKKASKTQWLSLKRSLVSLSLSVSF